MWTDSLRLSHEEDEKVLECQTRIKPGVVGESDSVNIHVLCEFWNELLER